MPTPTLRYDLPRTYRPPSAPSRQGPRFIGSTGTGGAFQLANALSSLNPAIQNALQSGFDFYRQQEAQRADEFSREYKGSYADAVRSGDLPAGASVFFREQVLRNEVKTKAQSYQTWLQGQWHSDSAIKGAGEDQFEAWVEGKTADYVGSELSGYGQKLLSEEFDGLARAAQTNLASHHIADGFRRTKERGMQSLNDGVLKAIRQTAIEDPKVLAQELIQNGGSLNGIDREYQIRENVALQRIQGLMDNLAETGVPYSEINKSVVDSIALVAEQTGDTSAFGILDEITTGTGKLGQTRYAQAVRFDAEMKISSRQMTELRNHWAIEDRMKAEHRELAWGALVRDTMEQPEAAVQAIESFIAQYPDMSSAAVSWANSIGKPLADSPERDRIFLEAKARAQVGDLSAQEIVRGALAGNYTTAQASHLMDELQSSQRSLSADLQSDGLSLRNDLLRQVEDPIYKQATPAQERGALEMQRIYMRTIQQRQEQGKPMTPLEELDLRDNLQQRYVSQFSDGGAIEVPDKETGGEATETEAQPEASSSVQLPGGQVVQVPQNHIQMLQQNAGDPAILQQFDQKYGVGAAAAILMP